MNASVKKKDGKQILESSLRSVSTMLTRKINAVKVNVYNHLCFTLFYLSNLCINELVYVAEFLRIQLKIRYITNGYKINYCRS